MFLFVKEYRKLMTPEKNISEYARVPTVQEMSNDNPNKERILNIVVRKNDGFWCYKVELFVDKLYWIKFIMTLFSFLKEVHICSKFYYHEIEHVYSEDKKRCGVGLSDANSKGLL